VKTADIFTIFAHRLRQLIRKVIMGEYGRAKPDDTNQHISCIIFYYK